MKCLPSSLDDVPTKYNVVHLSLNTNRLKRNSLLLLEKSWESLPWDRFIKSEMWLKFKDQFRCDVMREAYINRGGQSICCFIPILSRNSEFIPFIAHSMCQNTQYWPYLWIFYWRICSSGATLPFQSIWWCSVQAIKNKNHIKFSLIIFITILISFGIWYHPRGLDFLFQWLQQLSKRNCLKYHRSEKLEQ